jgi:hypothetical protein
MKTIIDKKEFIRQLTPMPPMSILMAKKRKVRKVQIRKNSPILHRMKNIKVMPALVFCLTLTSIIPATMRSLSYTKQ